MGILIIGTGVLFLTFVLKQNFQVTKKEYNSSHYTMGSKSCMKRPVENFCNTPDQTVFLLPGIRIDNSSFFYIFTTATTVTT